MNKFKVNDACIGCRACLGLAPKNFEIEKGKAIVINQPSTDEENTLSMNALNICPTSAIEIIKGELITADSSVRETLEKYPILKEKMIELSPKFKTMQNPLMWNSIAKFATFKNSAKMTGLSICEILHFINKELGMEEELLKSFPHCIKELELLKTNINKITWNEPNSTVAISSENMEDIAKSIELINNLSLGSSIVFEGAFESEPIIKVIDELGYKYNIVRNKINNIRLSIFNEPKNSVISSGDNNDNLLDVRNMTEDPFDIIIKKAYSLNDGEEFILVQSFIPDPMINMLEGMGFDNKVRQKNKDEYWIYLRKRVEEKEIDSKISDKPSVTIQSATPVGYPIIMRLLQSEKLKGLINIKELKVWEETEKHLGWIVNKKADISFSAVITASKLKDNDVKMPIVFVWDNFTILTRGYEATSFRDLIGKKIYLPLFEDAPPAKITKYLIQSKGYNVDDFEFVFGKPFGRPKEMLSRFVKGEIDTVLLREPEAGFAVKTLKNLNVDFSEISYGKVWNEINEGFGMFPNAGVILKGEFARKYPEIVKELANEIKASIDWVNNNKKESALLSYDMMRNSKENVEEFLNRATFKYVAGEELVKKVSDFYSILIENNILNTKIDDKLLNMFR
ncbi:4Fe-4S domain-containing protein [Helicovermis profundi]|uniref:DUF1858 domain-containing protein n=1 Tax=Helicovermis profundi TaxID=3065157 RepID=A0AAU9E2E8_9FIRM|nr:hypothetical protein HLPR_09320 [Clostridia bacterium S502]